MKQIYHYLNNACQLQLTDSEKKRNANYFLDNQITLDMIFEYLNKNKVLNNFILNFSDYNHPYFNNDEVQKRMKKEQLRLSVSGQKISNMIDELEKLGLHDRFIKGAFLRNIYEEYYGNVLYRYSRDVDIFFTEESEFWNSLENLHPAGYIQDEALYVIRKNNVTEFMTVHYKKNNIRLDLHAVGFPLQLFCNLDIAYEEKNLQYENSLLILLAHSVSHELISLRDINDLHVLLQKSTNWNIVYIEEKLKLNRLENIFSMYLAIYNEKYQLFPHIFNKYYKGNKYDTSVFPLRIKKQYLRYVLRRKNYMDVMKIRYFDFYLRNIITKIHKSEKNIKGYMCMCRFLAPKNHKIYFLLNQTTFFPNKLLKKRKSNKVFEAKNVERGKINISNVNYVVRRDLYFDD